LLGTRQSGLPELKVAGLDDLLLIETARGAARCILGVDPDLAATEHTLLRAHVELFVARVSEPS